MPLLTKSRLACLFALCLGFARPARADGRLHSYALVIGSNRGGEGQGQLAYAEQDAERMAALLRELGRTPEDHIELLAEPKAADVERALARLREQLAAHAAAGEQAQVLFYYSGHARAHALSLGDEELSLSTLRASLRALPSTLTVVVLDACQSGAFSGVKGARGAADFSISSVRDLNSSGIAVMASSTGTELSQESSSLSSSYFTHHLLVSLRGAGDLDRNGRVSLDEAYAYAYQHTLSDTARTQVGSQHATLETELTGRGDVPLSYPVDADAQLALPLDVEGRVLVQRKDGPVLAELLKARGGTLLLAFPSGTYEVLVRAETTARSCAVKLDKGAVFTLAVASCPVVELPREQAKSEQTQKMLDRKLATESWFLELGYSVTGGRKDAYVNTLHDFGYASENRGRLGADVVLGYQLHPRLSLLARYDTLQLSQLRQFTGARQQGNQLDLTAQSAMLGLRLRQPLARRWVVAFAELDAGIVWSHAALQYRSESAPTRYPDGDTQQDFRGFAGRALVGLDFAFGDHVGAYLAAGYTYAPSFENGFGERHDSGGVTVVNGLRLNGVKGWW
jgi:hypothetical protein